MMVPTFANRMVDSPLSGVRTFIPLVLVILSCLAPGWGGSAANTPHRLQGSELRLFDGKTLGNWEVTGFVGHGEVEVKDEILYLKEGDPLTGVTWKGKIPDSDFVVSLEAMRVRGEDFFCGLTFPVAGSHCSLIVGGWGGAVVGLSSIDGFDASDNETTRKMYFDHGQWYRIRVEVARQRIRAWIDDDLVVDLPTENRSFSVRPDVWLSRPFGLAAWHTEAAFRNLRLIRLDSSASSGER